MTVVLAVEYELDVTLHPAADFEGAAAARSGMDTREARWKVVGSVLGGLGVIGSLVFVALEIRQNTAAVRSATIQAISEQSFTAVAQLVENADLRAAYEAATTGTDLTPEQRFHLRMFYLGIMRIQQNRYLQSQLGVLDLRSLLFVGGRGGAYSLPFFAEYWAEDRDQYPAEFQEFVEGELLPQNGASR